MSAVLSNPSEPNRKDASAALFARRLLLIGWDAADEGILLPLLKRGALPNLSRLLATGVAGELATLHPVSPPLLWTSALTGVTADRHGILNRVMPDPHVGGVRPVTPADRRAPALWDWVYAAGGRSHVVNLPCSHPAYDVGGMYVSDAAARGLHHKDVPALPGTFHLPSDAYGSDALTSALLDTLRVKTGELDPSLLARFLPEPGPVPAELPALLAACFTVHNLATRALGGDTWNLAALRYPGLLSFARIARAAPTEAHSAALREGGARLHDLFLGRLLDLAAASGEPTTVFMIAPQGLPSRADGFSGEETDAKPGFCVLSGAGIGTSGERMIGARLLDVMPTALHLLGIGWEPCVLPGRCLTKASNSDANPDRIFAVPSFPVPTPEKTDNQEDAALLRQLAESQLIASGLAFSTAHAERLARRQQSWLLARVYDHAGRYDKAVSLLRELRTELQEDLQESNNDASAAQQVTLLLAQELIFLNQTDEAVALLTALPEDLSDGAANTRAEALLMLAECAVAKGRTGEAKKRLAEAASLPCNSSLLLIRIAYALFRLRRPEAAAAAFARAAQLDPRDPLAWLGRAGSALLARRYADAFADSDQSIRLRRDVAITHLVRARALRGLKREEESLIAYKTALSLGLREHEAEYVQRVLARAGHHLP